MLSVCLVMLFSRMDKILDYPIPWRIFTQMCLGGAFTMDVLYRECGKKLRLSPSKFFVQYGYISLFLSLSLLKNSPSVVLYSPLANRLSDMHKLCELGTGVNVCTNLP